MIKKLRRFSLEKFVSSVTIVALLLLLAGPQMLFAASVTSFSVLLTREKASTVADQTITFTVPAAIGAGETIILTYDNSTSIPAGLDYTDIDLTDDDVDVTLAATSSGTTWGVVRTSATVITFTNGTTAVDADSVVAIEIGTHATVGANGDQQITNGSAGTTTLTLSGTMGGATPNTGTAAMPIIADDQVVITATVAPTITFAISDNTISFGTLNSGAARWATGDGTSTDSDPDPGAHTLTASTNATGGYIVTYNGATLTSGSDTIDVANGAGNTLDDADGDPGTEQFGLSIETDGSTTSTITPNYAYAGTPDWHWTAGTTTTIITDTGPSASEVYNMHYLANISGTTEAGAYTTTVTYIATGTF